MKAAISVELGGSMFALEERAYLALRSYLDRAGERLGAHPDRGAVLAGLERSIAAKLAESGDAQRGLAIGEPAMLAALKQVGRVDGPALDDSGRASSEGGADTRPTRRLYRVRKGQQVAGVCTGLAAYTGIDVTTIRIIFLLGTLFTGGTLALLYLLLMLVMPLAADE